VSSEIADAAGSSLRSRQEVGHAFWLADDRVVAGMQVNLWDDGIAPVEELIRSRQPVDADRLADTSVPLAAHRMV
jgi:3-phenylpropionate/trans-cinnamate dioxygenase ferredoxin reductase subunit